MKKRITKYIDLRNPIVIAVLVVLLVVVFDVIFLSAKTKQINAKADATVEQWKQYYENLAATSAAEQDPGTTQYQISEDAEYLAKVVAGCSTYYSENVQRAVAWCVLNRVDSALYPDSIIEVCQQANQWQGYDNADVLDSIYVLCQQVIDTWKANGHRDVPQDCLFFRMTENGIELRTDFKGGNTWLITND